MLRIRMPAGRNARRVLDAGRASAFQGLQATRGGRCGRPAGLAGVRGTFPMQDRGTFYE